MDQKGGVIKLPPGFRFHPTDEELVLQYLRRKVFSCPLPASIMPDVHLSSYDPWDIPAGGAVGCGERERYFFHLTKWNSSSSSRKVSRAAGSGYWKVTGKDRRVTVNGGKQVVGMKKVMVFYTGKPSNGSRTDWFLHEYRLAQNNSNSIPPTHKGNWVLCRVFQKERSSKDKDGDLRTSKLFNNQEDAKSLTAYVDFTKLRYQHGMLPEQEMDTSSCVTQNSDDEEGEENSNNPQHQKKTSC